MKAITITIPTESWKTIREYLLNSPFDEERAAFGFLRSSDTQSLELFDWIRMDGEMLDFASSYHITLSDRARQTVIKSAHDRNAALIEFHSHTGPYPAQFSASDIAGFREWVPHVLWRLPDRPYIAVVVTERDFDTIWWSGHGQNPSGMVSIRSGLQLLSPSGITVTRSRFSDDKV